MCILEAAETMIAQDSCNEEGDAIAAAAIESMLEKANELHLPVDTPVLQTADSLRAWKQVLHHQRKVEEDIREVDHWEERELKLVSINAGMPCMVCLVQGVFLATARLEHSQGFGSRETSQGLMFWTSVGVLSMVLVAAVAQLLWMQVLIRGAARSLTEATQHREMTMEKFTNYRAWGVLGREEIGCLSHIAARKGMVRSLQRLLHGGANPWMMNTRGEIPLDVTRAAGMDETRRILERHGEDLEVDADDSGGGQSTQKGLLARGLLRLRQPSVVGSPEGGTHQWPWANAVSIVQAKARWPSRRQQPFPNNSRSGRSGELWDSKSRGRGGGRSLDHPEFSSSIKRAEETGGSGEVVEQVVHFGRRSDSGQTVLGEKTGLRRGWDIMQTFGRCCKAASKATGEATSKVEDRPNTGTSTGMTSSMVTAMGGTANDHKGEQGSPPTVMTSNFTSPPLQNNKARGCSTSSLLGEGSDMSFRRRQRTSTGQMLGNQATGQNPQNPFSPAQTVLNISWALGWMKLQGTPSDRRRGYQDFRAECPFHVPPMYLLGFTDMVEMGEIPRRSGDRFLGHPSKGPIHCMSLTQAEGGRQTSRDSEHSTSWTRAEASGGCNPEQECRRKGNGRDPVVVYVSHRWLEPDFKNPDNHSKTKFYQVYYLVQKLAQSLGRSPHDFYLWIDYSCVNQQDPAEDLFALPYILDSCDLMAYIEHEEYWDRAWPRTEHFLFHKLRRLRRWTLCSQGVGHAIGGVFSISADGQTLTRRSYKETFERFKHHPSMGQLTLETDRLYLWTLVLALEYEIGLDFQAEI
ncbi:unnamed protein product, partial [Discosporangium mesarthrocarpum]